ncbi:MAG TPA: serine hydrolase domain-containing protein [Gemmatimonadales bacterium]|nr:serine hydrolase domain-containing protein [Gemmatimonadales bacterium]
MRTARLHLALQRHLDSGEVPGIVALVHHAGREHVETLGTMAFGSDTPVRRNTIFRLASTTKPITAVAGMILVEECRLRLDDPLDDWLPELRSRRVLRTVDGPLDDTVPAKRPITLRDLLTFRSGYGDFALFAPASPFQQALEAAGLSISTWPYRGTPDEFVRRLGELPLAHQPGERWLYHTSAEILGVLIARVSGRPFGTFLRERIFEPLGMTDTGFQVPEAKVDRLPTCYGRDMVTGVLVELDQPHGQYAQSPGFESGAGGLVSTVDDLLAFGRMMLGDCAREARVLSRPTIELMRMDHLTPEQKAVSPFFEGFWACHGWGLGLGIVTGRAEPADVPGRFGWDGAFGTSFWMDPKERVVGVLMTQRRPDRLALPPVVLDFWNSVYQLIDE